MQPSSGLMDSMVDIVSSRKQLSSETSSSEAYESIISWSDQLVNHDEMLFLEHQAFIPTLIDDAIGPSEHKWLGL